MPRSSAAEERGRFREAALGMGPSDEGLDSHERAVGHRDDGLVDEPQLFALECSAELALHAQTLDHALAHLLVEGLDASATTGLGSIHRSIRVAQNVHRLCSSPRRRRPLRY